MSLLKTAFAHKKANWKASLGEGLIGAGIGAGAGLLSADDDDKLISALTGSGIGAGAGLLGGLAVRKLLSDANKMDINAVKRWKPFRQRMNMDTGRYSDRLKNLINELELIKNSPFGIKGILNKRK